MNVRSPVSPRKKIPARRAASAAIEPRYARSRDGSRQPVSMDDFGSARLVAIGAQMRLERKRLDMTLDDLADTTGLNKGYLSRIERGHKAPALATVLKLAAAFKISVGELLGENLSRQAVNITRANTGRKLKGQGDGLELLVPGSTVLNSFIIRPDSQFGHESLREHGGEELVYVLTGSVELSFRDRKVVLKSGDCARFPGHLQHRLRRLGSSAAAALVVVANQT